MNTTKTAGAVLSEVEAKLRELVGQAAADGEYDLAVRMATIAKNVAALAHAFEERDPGHQPHPAVIASAVPASGVTADVASEVITESPAPAPVRRRGRRGAKRVGRPGHATKKGVYPKFYRDGDYLVKVSWSKKERGEYQHKAPRRVAELLAAAIGKQSGNGRLFTSEDIFPLKDPQGGGDVPSYQAYAALAWFRQSGLVQPHGRRGYTLKKNGRLSELLTAGWQKLSESPK